MHKGVADPLEVVAAEISDESILLCLDEFMVCSEFIDRLSFLHIALDALLILKHIGN